MENRTIILQDHNRITRFLFGRKPQPIPTEREHNIKDSKPLSKFLWFWVNGILRRGYDRVILPCDIPYVPREEAMEIRFGEYKKYLERHPPTAQTNYIELWAMIYALRWKFVISFILKLIQIACQLGMSVVSRDLIEEAERLIVVHGNGSHANAVGYLIGLCLLDLVALLCDMSSLYMNIMISEYARTLSMAIIHDKMLRLGPQQRHDFSAAKIMTISSSDCRRATVALIELNSLLTMPFYMGATIGVLLYMLGVSGLPGIGLLMIGLVLSGAASVWVSKIRMSSMPFQDRRVSLTRETLKNISIIKFYGWEKPYHALIKGVRKVETKFIRYIELVDAINIAFVIAVPNLAGALSFGVKIVISSGLSASRAFPALTLFQMFQPIFGQVSFALTTAADAAVAFRRMNKFFRLPEVPSQIESLSADEAVSAETGKPIVAKIENGAFAWTITPDEEDQSEKDDEKKDSISISSSETESKTVLQGINIELLKGTMTLVVGTVGSGKTSLLSTFANTIPKSSGRVLISPGVKVTTVLSMWSQNAPIRDNIIFGSDWDHKKYTKVVEVCDLGSDFELFAKGDETEVGENGVTLSGGQRARLALARCLYADGDLIILDDVLSAMDSKVGNYIYRRLLELTKTENKTILFSTNNLKMVPMADYVITLDGKGSAVQSLARTEPTLMEPDSIQIKNEQKHLDEVEKETQEMDAAKALAISTSDHLNSVEMTTMAGSGLPDTAALALGEFHKTQTRNSIEETASVKEIPASYDLEKLGDSKVVEVSQMDDENRAMGTVKVGVLIRYFRLDTVFGFIAFVMVVVSLMIFATSRGLSNVILGWWTSDHFHTSQGFNLGMYTMDMALNAVFYAVFANLLTFVTTASSTKLHNLALQGLYKAPMSFFQANPLGRLLMRFTEDLVNLDVRLLAFARMTFMSLFAMLGSMVVVFVYIPWTVLCLAPIFICSFILMAFYRTTSRELNRCQQLFDSRGMQSISEHIDGQETIVAFGQAEESQRRLNERLDDVISATMFNEAANFWMATRGGLMCEVIDLVALFLAVYNIFNLNPSEVGMVISLLPSIRQNLTFLFPMYALFDNQLNSVERLDEYATSLPVEGSEVEKKLNPNLAGWEPTKCSIDFNQASLRYRDGLPLALNNLSVHIEGGKKIGICGRTGAGKSTTISALFRLVELTSGTITIDGQDISEVPLETLRKAFSIIPQSPVLFQGTIRSNLDPFEQLSDSEIITALNASGLTDTNGKFALTANIEAEGTNFSLGERQMLALARVMVRSSRILILDEATAAVDQATDERIQQAIKKRFDNCTVLCIAHRLETIMDYDEILVMGPGGRMLEMGPPNELYQRNGAFTSMCEEAGIRL